MPMIMVRLVLLVAVLLGAPMVYIAVFVGMMEALGWGSSEVGLLIAGLPSAALVVGGWCLVWLGEVRVTVSRVLLTAGSVGATAAVATGIGGFLAMLFREEEIAIIVGQMAWLPMWLSCAALISRESKAERAARLQKFGIKAVACPNCGYNLTGLKQAVCPECGAQYTLDQLFAAVAEDKSLART